MKNLVAGLSLQCISASLFISLAVISFFNCQSLRAADLILLGDSTMADQHASPTAEPLHPLYGWGELLQDYLDPNHIMVKNFALNGASSKSFIDEGLWNQAKAEISSGDYVLIQFGHNDQKTDGLRYTNPYTVYSRNLKFFVKEIKELGGMPLLLTPVSRGFQDANGALAHSHIAYATAAKITALELKTPLIDMLSATEMYLTDGENIQERINEHFLVFEPGDSQFYPNGHTDLTHTSLSGATAICELFIQELISMDHPLVELLQ